MDGLLDSTSFVYTVHPVGWSNKTLDYAVIAEIRQRVRERLTSVLAPGNWPLLTSRLRAGNWFPFHSVRLPRAHGDQPPSLAMLDLAAVGEHLTAGSSEMSELWRRFVKAHMMEKPVPTSPRAWIEAISKFQLFTLRQTAGLLEDGIFTTQKVLIPATPGPGVLAKDLEVGPQLGTGAFGVVKLARHVILPNLFYAIKTVRKPAGDSEADRDLMHRIQTERHVMQRLSLDSRTGRASLFTRNLFVRLISAWEDDAEFHLVMPAALGGDVFEMLQAHGRMTEEALKFYVACVVLGLQHLHSLGIVYRDLKSANVILTAEANTSPCRK
ncbi:MAG: hypothetical protein SGPRY_012754 [Prymnesium sp.]